MSQHVEQQLVLPEDLEFVGRFVSLAFGHFLNVLSCLSVQNSGGAFPGLVGGHDEEVVDLVAGLDHPVEKIIGDVIAFEIVEDCNGPVVLFVLSGLGERGEEIPLVEEFPAVVLVPELRFSFFGILADKELTVLKYLKDGSVDPEEAEAFILAGGVDHGVVVVLNFHLHAIDC